MKRLFLIGIILTLCFNLSAQVGGTRSYEFLNLANSARVASLGGKNISLSDKDLDLAFHNPALLTDGLNQNAVLNYVNYFMDINYGYASYARHLDGIGNIAAGLHYVNYGEFIAANEKGEKTGSFRASDYVLNLMYSRRIDSVFYVGVNVKPIYSQYEKYNSFGVAMDIGATYTGKEGYFSAGLALKNIGYMLDSYTKGNHEPLPFEIQAGISQRLKHAPFRVSITAHQLQKPVLTYDEGEEESTSFLTEEDESKLDVFGDNVLRHAIIGLEFIPIENLNIRAGYNFQRRKELQLQEKGGAVGFSWGFGLKFNRFHVNYGRATYHMAGATNHFSLLVKIDEFYKKAPN